MRSTAAHFLGSALGGTLCVLALAGNLQAAESKPKAAAPAAAGTNAAPAAPVEEKTIILVKGSFEEPTAANHNIDPFFPTTKRPPYVPEVVTPPPVDPKKGTPQPADCYEEVALKGVSSLSGGRLLALINQTSMEKGEIANVKTQHRGTIRIEVVDIKEQTKDAQPSVIIRAIEVKLNNQVTNLEKECNPKEIFLLSR